MNEEESCGKSVAASKWKRRLFILGSVVLVLYGAESMFHHWQGGVPGKLVTPVRIQEISGSKNLVVVVHGYRDEKTNDEKTREQKTNMAHVLEATKSVRSGADIVFMKFPAQTFSNADCFQVAREIRDEINALDKTSYDKIELVGYSMGALLLRKAYIYGWGLTQDCPPKRKADGSIDSSFETLPQNWVKKVDRFVLLAGMNRGWTTHPQTKGTNFEELEERFLVSSGKFIGWATDTGKLIRQCERGEPFVANLRLQWLEAMREVLPKHEITPPKVIQLLGDIDDRVSEEDSRDVMVANNFVWVQLVATNHADAPVLDLPETADPKERSNAQKRAKKFMEAFGDDDEIGRLRLMSPTQPVETDPDIVEAVIVLHGIRDRGGGWTSGFEEELQSYFRDHHKPEEKLLIYRPSYGYFAMGPFLLGVERLKNVRWFMDEMTELKAKYPKLKTIHFIGHSNGTYVLAKTLENYRVLEVGKVALAGSVLPTDFNWMAPEIRDRYEKVRNYAGRSDWVVGWFPGLFEFKLFKWLNKDLGSAGFNGFTKPSTVSNEAWEKKVAQNEFQSGGHGEIIDASKISIVSFLTTGDEGPRKTEERLAEAKKPTTKWEWFVRLLSDNSFLVWGVILLVLIVFGYFWCRFTTIVFAKVFHPRLAPATALVAYCGVIVILLQFF